MRLYVKDKIGTDCLLTTSLEFVIIMPYKEKM